VLSFASVLLSVLANAPVGILLLPVIWWQRRYARIA
jgi:hypothetical protein